MPVEQGPSPRLGLSGGVEPAFADAIEARRFGPLVPTVAQYHAGAATVGETNGFGGRGRAGLDTTRHATVEYVLANYGGTGSHALHHYVRTLGSPRDVTYKARGDYAVIGQSLIADYFAAERERVLAGGVFVP